MTSFAQDAGSVRALAVEIAAGRLTSVALVQRCLDRIAAVDGQVQAWKLVLADAALAEAARVLRPGGRWVFSVTHPIRWAFPDDPGPDPGEPDAEVVVRGSDVDPGP